MKARRKGGNHTDNLGKECSRQRDGQYKSPERRVPLAYWRHTKSPGQLEQNEGRRMMGTVSERLK